MKIERVNRWTSEDGTKTRWYVTLEDGTEAVSFTELTEDTDMTGWTLEEPKQEGWKPMLRGPRSASGGRPGAPAAFRNTREGFEMEQRSIHASVALQRSIDYLIEGTELETVLHVADEFFEWLTKTSGGGVSPPRVAAPEKPTAARGRKQRVEAGGSGSPSPPPAPRCPSCGSDQIARKADGVSICLDCSTEGF